MRRKILVLAVVTLAIMVLMVTPAFAKTGSKSGGYWAYKSTTQQFLGGYSTAPSYVEASATVSPHAGYSTTTGKCKVCHAVHGAGISTNMSGGKLVTEKLLRSTAADSCTYCHLGAGAFAYDPYYLPVNVGAAPYNTAGRAGLPSTSYENYHSNDSNVFGGANNPRSGHSATHGHDNPQGVTPDLKSYKGCVSCHSVHGADTIEVGGLSPFILKDDPAKGVTNNTGWVVTNGVVATATASTAYGAYEAPVTTQAQFCEDCHNGTELTAANGTKTQIIEQADFNTAFASCGAADADWGNPPGADAEHKKGATCHNSVQEEVTESVVQFGAFNSKVHNERSHIMTDELTPNPLDPKAQIAGMSTKDGAGLTAWTNGCATCHTAKKYTQGDPNEATFPHFSSGQELINGFTNLNASDSPCMTCHAGDGSNWGVGVNY